MPYKDKEVRKEYHKQYRLKNKDKRSDWGKRYYLKNSDRIKEKSKQYRLNNKEYYKQYLKLYRLKHIEGQSKKHKQYYLKHRDMLIEQSKLYSSKHKNRRNEIYKIRIGIDLNFRLRCLLSSRISKAIRYKVIKKYNKSKPTMKLVGCSLEYLKDYLECQFDDEMSWSNYGAWHIDHIIPCAFFDLTKSEQQTKCFHYSNLQPLWARDNISKGSKQ